MSAHTQDQDKWLPNEVEQVVLSKLNISNWLAGRLIQEAGFEFRYTDPDVHPRPGAPMHDGMIFGSKRVHDKLFDWFERQLAIPAPVARVALEAPAEAPHPIIDTKPAREIQKRPDALSGENKGKLAYEARTAGDGWKVIGLAFGLSSPLNAAKKHAESNGLPWPIGSSEAS